MKVWELIAELSKYPAGDTVTCGIEFESSRFSEISEIELVYENGGPELAVVCSGYKEAIKYAKEDQANGSKEES